MRRFGYCMWLVFLFFTMVVPVLADDGGDQMVLWGDRVIVAPGDSVGGNLVVFGGSVEVQEGGRVRGDLVAIVGKADVDGHVEGSLVVVGGDLNLRSHAIVGEDMVTVGASVTRSEGARVFGQEVRGLQWGLPESLSWRWVLEPSALRNLRWSPVTWPFGLGRALLRWTVRTLALMALGVVVALLFPRHTALVARTASTVPLPSFGAGLLTFVVLLFLVPVLVIICIGIPVVVLLSVVLVAALLLGRVGVGALVGKRLLSALKETTDQPLLEVVLGIGLVELVASVPCLGALVGGALALLGLGAVALTRFGTSAYKPRSGQSALNALDASESVKQDDA